MTDQPSANAEALWHSLLCQHRKIVNSSAVDAWRSAVMDAQSAFAAALPKRPDFPPDFAKFRDSEKVDCFAELADNQRLRTAIRIRNKHSVHRETDVLISDPDGATALTKEEALSVVIAFEEALVQVYGFRYPEAPTSADVELMKKAQEILIEELRRSKEEAEAKLRASEATVRALKATVEAASSLRASADDSNRRRRLRQHARAAGVSLEAVQRRLPMKALEEITFADIDGVARASMPAPRSQQYGKGTLDSEEIGVWQWARGSPGRLAPQTARAFWWLLAITAVGALLTTLLFRLLSAHGTGQ